LVDREARGSAFLTLLAIFRRRGWLLAVCLVLAALGGFIAVSSAQKSYSASATVLFQDPQIAQDLFGDYTSSAYEDPTTLQADHLALATQPEIPVRAASELHTSSAELQSAIAVTAAGASDLVVITATTPNPHTAASFANAYANQTVAYQIAVQRTQINEAAADVQRQIAALPASSSGVSSLKTRLTELQTMAALQTGNAQVTAVAQVPGGPSGPNKKKDLAFALFVGLLVGLAAMAIVERLDATIKDPDEVAGVVDLPVLATIATSREFGREVAKSGIDGLRVPVIADAFRLLATQLRYFNVDESTRSLLVTSATTGEGKSTVAWGLAVASAQLEQDRRVVLLDLDLRRSAVAQLSGQPRVPGVAEALLEEHVVLDDFIRVVSLGSDQEETGPELYVLPAGAAAPNPTELIASDRFRRLLDQLKDTFDLIVIDAPPILTVPDAIPVLNQVSGLLVVTRMGVSSRPALRALMRQLNDLGVSAFGVVHNSVVLRGTAKNAYYHYTRS
jgi:capsular exopolysaccharide synthesis family protein